MNKVICITGPTASGKTKLSIEIAKKLDLEVINVDRIQMMKHYDIGSAKITKDEMGGVYHHLIDFLEVNEDYTIFHFQKDARKIIDQNKVSLLVGGSGLYLKSALFEYEFENEKVDSIEEATNVTINEMYQEVIKKDPNYNLHPNNHQRIMRAYKLLQKGVIPSSKTNKDEPLYNILMIYLDVPRKVLLERLKIRLNQMFQNGFIDEVRKLQKLEANLNVIGYNEVNQYLLGKITYDECYNLIIKNSMAYAKRQKTWFKNQTNAIFVNALEAKLIENTLLLIENFLKE